LQRATSERIDTIELKTLTPDDPRRVSGKFRAWESRVPHLKSTIAAAESIKERKAQLKAVVKARGSDSPDLRIYEQTPGPDHLETACVLLSVADQLTRAEESFRAYVCEAADASAAPDTGEEVMTKAPGARVHPERPGSRRMVPESSGKRRTPGTIARWPHVP